MRIQEEVRRFREFQYKLTKSDLVMIEQAKQDYTKYHVAHLGMVMATKKVWDYTAEGLIAQQCPIHPKGDCYILVQRS